MLVYEENHGSDSEIRNLVTSCGALGRSTAMWLAVMGNGHRKVQKLSSTIATHGLNKRKTA